MQRRQSGGAAAIASPLITLLQSQDKAAKQALYNAAALVAVGVAVFCCYALCLVLEPFFKPLVWAGLVGCLLHPLKRLLTAALTRWLKPQCPPEGNLAMAVLLSPLHIASSVLRAFDSFVTKYWKIGLSILAAVFGTFWLLCVFPWRYLYFLVTVGSFVDSIFLFFLDRCTTVSFITFVVVYGSLLCAAWSTERRSLFRKTSLLVWTISTAYISNLTRSLKSVTFISLQILAFFGFCIEVKEAMNSDSGEKSLYAAVMRAIGNEKSKNLESTSKTEEIDHSTAEREDVAEVDGTPTAFPERSRLAFQRRTLSSLPLTSTTFEERIVADLKRAAIQKELRARENTYFPNIGKSESSTYIKFLIWACVFVSLWKNSWLWPLMVLMLLIYSIKAIGNFFGIWDFLSKIMGNIKNDLSVWYSDRYDAIMPAHIAGIVKISNKVNKNLYSVAMSSVDSVATCVVIVGLILFFTCAPIFLGIQIYSEGINVVQLTGSVINRTIVHNPELRQLLPPGWDETLDSLLDNAYVYGREGLSKAIKSILQDTDSEKSLKIENQLLELWDRIYQVWMTHNTDSIGPKVDVEALEQTWNSFISDITKTPEMLNTSGLLDFAKQNVGTLMSLLESVWSLLKGNLTLVFGSVSAISSILLGGGSAVLNFLLGLIVFFTTLFYLLNSSGTLYKPIELMTKFSPINGSQFGLAMTDAVNGVFIATLKMAFFYGLWTWLIHSIFGAKIVYLPSALAAILAAIPFLGTYLACIPAVLDLWLAQGSPILAILLAVCQFAPTSYVDTVIYKEIKNGGHPYFTGLAIAGGIFCLGVEGAIFGPLLLCCLLVAFNLSSAYFKDTPLEEHISATL